MDPYAHPDVAAIIEFALREDLRFADDLTCRALVPPGARLAGVVRAKQPGVLCGLPLFPRVFAALGGAVEFHALVADGTRVEAGAEVLRFSGDAATLLKGERTALNLAQRLSGTATLCRRYVDAVAGTRARILDTRKTTPGLRHLQKHAVACAGGVNHRSGLYDQVLIKENHIALMAAAARSSERAAPSSESGKRRAVADAGAADAGTAAAGHALRGPAEAVHRARAALGPGTLIEVEIEGLDDLEPVIAAGADIVLLDNCAPEVVGEAVRRRGERRVLLEASGGIGLDNVRDYALTGVDRISIGALTHGSGALDLSMRCAPA